MKILIQSGRVIDPTSGLEAVQDLAIAAGRIVAMGAQVKDFSPERVIDATDCVVAPGFVDLCTRLR